MRHKEIPGILAFDDAQEWLAHDAPSPMRTERVSIYEPLGRVLATAHPVLNLPAVPLTTIQLFCRPAPWIALANLARHVFKHMPGYISEAPMVAAQEDAARGFRAGPVR
jgi:hypothetical protein